MLESNFKKCARNFVKMNYRLAFVFSYERFENAVICIICFGPSTRFRPILNIPVFRKNGASLDLLNIVEFSDLGPDSRYLLRTVLKFLRSRVIEKC